MKVQNLSGKITNWSLTGYSTNKKKGKSDLHLKARKLLKEVYKSTSLLEEISIPIDSGITLFLDFYLPLFHKAFEVMGQQHFSYSSFFHGSIENFKRSKSNDSKKLEWCELNGITLIYLNFDESEEEWKQKILN